MDEKYYSILSLFNSDIFLRKQGGRRSICTSKSPYSKIKLVMDNLNTQSIASLYKAFNLENCSSLGQAIVDSLMLKQGSWLKIAEFSIMPGQGFGQRIPLPQH